MSDEVTHGGVERVMNFSAILIYRVRKCGSKYLIRSFWMPYLLHGQLILRQCASFICCNRRKDADRFDGAH
ncbi:hypothetical protein D3C84_1081170 [compost metagenome]